VWWRKEEGAKNIEHLRQRSFQRIYFNDRTPINDQHVGYSWILGETMPFNKTIPPEAGYPGKPIDDGAPVLKKAFSFFNDEIRPRREFHPDLVHIITP